MGAVEMFPRTSDEQFDARTSYSRIFTGKKSRRAWQLCGVDRPNQDRRARSHVNAGGLVR